MLCVRLNDGEAVDEQSKREDHLLELEATRAWESELPPVPGEP
jgi:hypothetical protein